MLHKIQIPVTSETLPPGSRRITFTIEKAYRCDECGDLFTCTFSEEDTQVQMRAHVDAHFAESSNAPR